MTLVSSCHFPRHSHDQFGIGVIAFGAQRSWSGLDPSRPWPVTLSWPIPARCTTGALGRRRARWRMLYLEPALMAREVEQEMVGQVEIVRLSRGTHSWPGTSPAVWLPRSSVGSSC